MTHNDDETEELPDALIEALKSADEAVPLITARVDREVLKMARDQFAGRKPAWRRRPAWAAVAATALIAIFVVQLDQPTQQVNLSIKAARPADITDVLKLARERAGDPAAQVEIDALAMRVVSLSPAGASQ
ncbi:MAG: hypothetical protein GQ577_00840 [Woeseiaceae bacterium]|nr:hypothetical protein [Woeseiaceae bacterium]